MGIRIKGNRISSEELKKLANLILNDESCKMKVMKHRDFMKQAGGIHKAADIVETFIRSYNAKEDVCDVNMIHFLK